MRYALLLSCLGLCIAAAPAHAGDFVDTRLSFTLTGENLLVKPGETNPSVPGFRAGAPNQLGVLFFDNYDTRYTGYENLTHLALFKKWDKGRVTVETALVLRLLQFTDVNLSSIDDGSYIKGQFWFDRDHEQEGHRKTNLSITLFPLSADRMRLGYSYRISWGGSPIFFKYNPDLPSGGQFIQNTAPAPGAKIQVADERWYVYGGFKTSTYLDRNPAVNEQVVIWAVLAGAGVDIIKDHMRLEANGGYFQRGTNPLFFGTTVGGGFTSAQVNTYGATLQLSVFNGLAPTTSLDLRLYRNDPMSADRYFKRPEYAGGFRWLIATEWSAIGTELQDPDAPGSTKIQPAYAGDLNVRLQAGYLRIKADFAMRSLSFILVNQPSLVPFQDLPNGSEVTEELFGSLGFDFFINRIGLTLGATAGVMRPATFTPPNGGFIQGPLMGNVNGTLATRSTLVVRNEGDVSILPEGQREVPIVAGKVELREDFLEYFAAIFQIYYQYDPNQTILTKAADGTSIRGFNYPHRLGINFAVQARF